MSDENPKISQFLTGRDGEFSSIRAQTWLVILCFCGDWISHIIRNQPFTPDISVVGIILGILSAKVTQKYVEDNSKNSTTSK